MTAPINKDSLLISSLISLLDIVNQDSDINTNDDNHPIIAAIIFIASQCLTHDFAYYNFISLQDAGYKTMPAERDSFGWLTGWIILKNPARGRILFG